MRTAVLSESNQLFPVFLKLEQRRILLIGAGEVAVKRLNSIIDNTPVADVLIVAKEISAEVRKLTEKYPSIKIKQQAFDPSLLEDVHFVIVALNDIELTEEIAALAHERGILVNTSDKTDYSDFFIGSVVKKGQVKIALSTNGKSPVLARRLKETLNDAIPDGISDSAENLHTISENLGGDFRKKVEELNQITSVLARNQKKGFLNTLSRTRLVSYLIAVPLLFILGYATSIYLPPLALQEFSEQVISGIDSTFFYFILAGFTAQMIDGALGMAYGVTASTFLLSLGVSPAASSASVHASEIVTSGVSGLMHLKFGNVNSKLFKNLLLPGIVGAILGAYILTSLEEYNYIIKPIVSVYTLALGCIIIYKAVKQSKSRKRIAKLFPLALFGGFLDSIGGGGWGPIVSSTLIAGGRNARLTIGSVNLAEFFVSLASSVTFFSLIGINYLGIVVGLIAGGIIASPLAAYLSNKLPVRALMIFVGIVVIVLSIKRIVS